MPRFRERWGHQRKEDRRGGFDKKRGPRLRPKDFLGLLKGTDRLVKEMKSLTKALQSHEKVMRELLAAI
ncbi:hypothetical protein ES706_00564 [subsurface metagenome]|nr:hypothetical protein [Hadesarchaea archaeon]